MLAHSAIKRLVEPAEVAVLVGFLAGERATMITGASYTMDGGWTTQGAGLDPVQSELAEGDRDHLRHGGRGRTSTVRVLADPIAEPSGLESAALDPGEGDPADDLGLLSTTTQG